MAWSLPGIYMIQNKINGNSYIGSSKNIRYRIITHKGLLSRNKHVNCHLQAAYNKYGEDSFVFKPILVCEMRNLLTYEQAIIDKMHPKYNIAKSATSPMSGRKHTELSKELMRSYHTADRKYAEFEYSWENPYNKGRRPSQTTIDKIRKSLTGRKRSIESIVKQSSRQMGAVRTYKTYSGLVGPDGTVYNNIDNLAKFLRAFGIKAKYIYPLLRGTNKMGHHGNKSYKGWHALGDNNVVAIRN
jgi:group I intron endonuclease